MAQLSLKNRIFKLRVSTCATFTLCLIAVIQLFASCGTYNYPHLPREALSQMLYKDQSQDVVNSLPDCTYEGILQSTRSIQSWELPRKYDDFSAVGIVNGSYAPAQCRPAVSVAVLVPYRNRQEQLDIFLPYMHNFLRKQNIHYKIFLIEQQDGKPFNRGLLFNAGAREALRERFPCLILHDVDLLPLNEGNLYACVQQPRHMSASIDKFRYVLTYPKLVGGALALRADHYRRLDGFSNRFVGWGGEDDDLAARIADAGLEIHRFPRELSEYTMLLHRPSPKSGSHARLRAERRRGHDGLAALRVQAVRVQPQRLATVVAVTL